MGPPELFTCQALFVNTWDKFTLDKPLFLCYIITMETMTEEQRQEEQRKVENRVKRWNESVERVKALQEAWRAEHFTNGKFNR
jgi:lysophospholipid acyltransferase (LPLAT)-like uncharacterized protein